MEQKIAIKIDDLTVAYNYKPVLWDIDLEIPEGVLMAIVGPNGAGKSTLIKSILGILNPIAGSVSIYDKPYKEILLKNYPVISVEEVNVYPNPFEDNLFIMNNTNEELVYTIYTPSGIKLESGFVDNQGSIGTENLPQAHPRDAERGLFQKLRPAGL